MENSFKVISAQEIKFSDTKSYNWAVVRPLNDTDKCNYDTLKNGENVVILSTHVTKGAADKSLRNFSKKASLSKDVDFPYQLSLTEKQAQVIINALDLYSRIGMGQLEEIAHILRSSPNANPDKILAVEALAREAADCWMGHVGGYNGISSDKVHDVFRIAWDLQQVIRYRLAWDRHPEGGIQVVFDEPLKSSKEPFAVIKKVLEDE